MAYEALNLIKVSEKPKILHIITFKGWFILLLNAECGIQHRLLLIPHSALRIPQRTEPFRTIPCGFRIPRCGFRLAIFGPHSACGTKKVKIILTFKNHMESHPMRNTHAECGMRNAGCGMRNPQCGMATMRNGYPSL